MTQFISADLFLEKALKFYKNLDNKNLDNKNLDNKNLDNKNLDDKEGILNLKAISSPFTEDELEILFMVDCSGSMSDTCSDGRNKMQHIIHTLKNMILYFNENPTIKAHITIYSFDDTPINILERTIVTKDNFNTIISKVEKIMPRGTTNIEKALEEVKDLVTEIKNKYPNSCISHIFMTDGEISEGSKNVELLYDLVDKTIKNAFIGFGNDHDSALLSGISCGENSNYYFIDKLENSGFVYGEILHSIVYKFMTNIRLTIQNGLIYNFKDNTWSQTLNVGEIVSESSKTFHILSLNPMDCFITVTGNTINNDKTENAFELIISSEETTEDLTKYNYRLKTLQYLYKVGVMLKNNVGYYDNFEEQLLSSKFIEHKNTGELNIMKNTLCDFIKEMKDYMKNNNLENDKLLKNLCDDIFICLKTINTKYGIMYTEARQNSQGLQRCYAVRETPTVNQFYCSPSDTDDLLSSSSQFPRKSLKFKRTRNVTGFDDDDDTLNLSNSSSSNSNLLDHELTVFDDTPYSTPTSTTLMRNISNSQKITIQLPFMATKIEEDEFDEL